MSNEVRSTGRRVTSLFLLAGMLLSVCPSRSLGRVILVPQDEPTIQSGVDAADEGDTVLVAPGTWAPVRLPALDLVLKSSSGAELTTIDGGDSTTVVTFEGAVSRACAVESFTISRGLGNGDMGGGVHLSAGASPTLSDLVVRDCSAVYGGGIRGLYPSDPLLRGCLFDANEASSRGGGGYLDGDGIVVEGCRFTGCTSYYDGGGLYVRLGEGRLEIDETEIDSCRVSHSYCGGGGLYIYAYARQGYGAAGIVQMDDCRISDCDAGYGGGAYIDYARHLLLSSTEIRNCYASYRGGGSTCIASTD